MKAKTIIKNALYSYKGITCRAVACIGDNVLVTHHKVFDALVPFKDLKKINSQALKLYLLEAKEGMGQ